MYIQPEIIDRCLARIKCITNDDFHGYRSEIWSAVYNACEMAVTSDLHNDRATLASIIFKNGGKVKLDRLSRKRALYSLTIKEDESDGSMEIIAGDADTAMDRISEYDKLDKQHSELIEERDYWESFVTDMAHKFEPEAEWSSACDLRKVLADGIDQVISERDSEQKWAKEYFDLWQKWKNISEDQGKTIIKQNAEIQDFDRERETMRRELIKKDGALIGIMKIVGHLDDWPGNASDARGAIKAICEEAVKK